MHDNKTKKTTVEALPTIIEELKKQGYIFKTLTKDTEPIQFLKWKSAHQNNARKKVLLIVVIGLILKEAEQTQG